MSKNLAILGSTGSIGCWRLKFACTGTGIKGLTFNRVSRRSAFRLNRYAPIGRDTGRTGGVCPGKGCANAAGRAEILTAAGAAVASAPNWTYFVMISGFAGRSGWRRGAGTIWFRA